MSKDYCPHCFCNVKYHYVKTFIKGRIICKSCRRRVKYSDTISREVAQVMVEKKGLIPLKDNPPEKHIPVELNNEVIHYSKLNYGFTMREVCGREMHNYQRNYVAKTKVQGREV